MGPSYVRFEGKIGKDREKEKGEDYSGDNKVMKKLYVLPEMSDAPPLLLLGVLYSEQGKAERLKWVSGLKNGNK